MSTGDSPRDEREAKAELIAGPCDGCGEKDYPLSSSGSEYCPSCAVFGIEGSLRRRVDELRAELSRVETERDSARKNESGLDLALQRASDERRRVEAERDALADALRAAKEALFNAQGEAYLGALIGDVETPSPLAACMNVNEVCRPALAAVDAALSHLGEGKP